MNSKYNVSNYCTDCLSLKHQIDAKFCYRCGAVLKPNDLMKFYQDISVPIDKIEIEQSRVKNLYDVFPFLLRKESNNTAEFAVIRDFPQADIGIADTKYHLCLDSDWKHVTLTHDSIKALLDDGFSWYHVLEVEKLY